MIDLEPDYLTEIRRILQEYLPNVEVRAFGSRVKGTAKPYSDLDLVIMTKTKMDWQKIETLKDIFSESNLPFIVDIVDWNSISAEFKQIIQQNYWVIQE